MRIFLSAGEASGDTYAAELIKALKERRQDLEFSAVAGPRVREQGAEIAADSTHWGSIGIYESLKVAPAVMSGLKGAIRELKKGPPGLCIPIDYGFMNIKVARNAKEMGWKVLYFIPPGSWRKTKQGADLPEVTDEIVTPFPWSADILNGMGASAHFFGHPLIDLSLKNEFAGERTGIAILPGSRIHEVKPNLEVIAAAIKDLGEPVHFGVARSISREKLAALWRQFGGGEAHYWDSAQEAFHRAKTAIVCSGTATLEAALCGCPATVIYRAAPMMYMEYKIRKPKFDWISLPNIILGRGLLTELIQEDASAEAIRREVKALLESPERQREVESGYAELRAQLGEPGAIQKTVDLALQMIDQISAAP